MTQPLPPEHVDLQAVARAKLVRVLGERRGDVVMGEVLAEIGLERVNDAEDLYGFAKALSGRGSFAGAVGGLLIVHALLSGARGDPRSKAGPPAT